VESAERLPELVSQALHRACSGRPGPVALALPEDMLTDTVRVADAAAYQRVQPGVEPDAIHRMRALLASAKRPLVIAGGSGWSQTACDDLRRFVETNNLPTGAAFRNQDRLDNHHANYIGPFGVGASAASDPIGAFEKWFTGLIDDVAVWNEALDDDAIMQLATGQRGPIAFEPDTIGDFNMDGVVTMQDFLVMAENFNSTFDIGEVSFSKGDHNIDGKVNLDDFLGFREVFNAPAGASAASAVPEPCSLLMVLVGSIALLSGRTRRR
jgi:hypothetical protein